MVEAEERDPEVRDETGLVEKGLRRTWDGQEQAEYHDDCDRSRRKTSRDHIAVLLQAAGPRPAYYKTGVDLAANNAINSEVGNIEGRFLGHHDAAPPAGDTDAPPPDDQQGDS
jgi:hypothetical protein